MNDKPTDTGVINELAAGNKDPGITGAMALGIGLATLSIVTPFTGVALGLIEADEPVHWAMRVFLLLFCTPFIICGALLFFGGFVMLVNGTVPGSKPFAVRAIWYLILQATRPWHIVGALPVALLVFQYYRVMRGEAGLFGVTERFLEQGMLLEFLAIHATGFLGAAMLIPTTSTRLKLARYGIIALLALIYYLATSSMGWEATLFLAYLMGMKLGPFFTSPPDMHTGANVGMRWGFQTCVFLAVVATFGGLESIAAGAAYWTVILFAELFGMMDVELLREQDLIQT